MKYSVITLMMILGMASSLQGQDEPTPPAQIEFQVQDEPVIIQSFSAPLGGGFGGEGGVITLQATGDALGGGDAGGDDAGAGGLFSSHTIDDDDLLEEDDELEEAGKGKKSNNNS